VAGNLTELLPVFSNQWAAACARFLNGQDGYRSAAANWEAAIVLTMTAIGADGGERRVFLDLYRGECREARAAEAADEEKAKYVLSGTAAGWQQVLTGTIPPLLAIMSGKLRITKGGLMDLMPHVGAAKELVAAASRVPASFPGDS
jgi:putative sterol carrier protein